MGGSWGAENDEHNRAHRLHPERTSGPARSRAARSLVVAFRPTYLMPSKRRRSAGSRRSAAACPRCPAGAGGRASTASLVHVAWRDRVLSRVSAGRVTRPGSRHPHLPSRRLCCPHGSIGTMTASDSLPAPKSTSRLLLLLAVGIRRRGAGRGRDPAPGSAGRRRTAGGQGPVRRGRRGPGRGRARIGVYSACCAPRSGRG
jgi:hypothetical protein